MLSANTQLFHFCETFILLQVNEQAEQLGELQDNFRETSETKEKLQETLTAAQTNLQEKQGLIVEKDAQITTFNIKVRELLFWLIVF